MLTARGRGSAILLLYAHSEGEGQCYTTTVCSQRGGGVALYYYFMLTARGRGSAILLLYAHSEGEG